MRTGACFTALPGNLHGVLNAAPDPMVVVEREGRGAALNAAAERFFGWAETEVLGEPMDRFVPGFVPDDPGANVYHGATGNGSAPDATSAGQDLAGSIRP
jgi:PAS domain-containing protein